MSIHRHVVVFFDSAFGRADGRTEAGGGGKGVGSGGATPTQDCRTF